MKSIDVFVLARLKFWAAAVFLCAPAVAMAGVDLVVNHTDSPDPVAAGGAVTYTVRVTNDSFTTDATGVNTTHSVPAGAIYQGFAGTGVSCSGMSVGAAGPGTLNCTLPDLAANGGEVIFTIQLKTTAQGTITLGADAASIEPDDQPANNSAPQTTTVNAGADLVMIKTPASTSAVSGSSFSWALSITNNGPDAATNLVVQDPVPTGFSVTSIPAGCTNSAGTITCNIAGPIASGNTLSLGNVSGAIIAAGGSTVTNTASVAVSGSAPFGTPQDPISGNNSAVANVAVTAGSDLKLTKSRSVGGNPLVGSSFNFVLTPTYSGDIPSGLTITDTIPANYTIGALTASQNGWSCAAAGQVVTCTKAAGGGVAGLNQALGAITIPVTVVTSGSGVTNSATISSSSPSDPVPGNNTASDGGVNLVDPTVNLGLTKTGPSPALVVQGIPFDYTIIANNTGTTGYYGDVRMTDNLPAGLTVNYYTLNGWSCSPAAPVVGPATINCDRTYTSGAPLGVGAGTPALGLNVTAATTGTINNSATVIALTCNLGSCNDGDTSSYIVTSSVNTGSADIHLLKNVDLPSVPAGDVLTYTLEIVNDTATYTSTSTNVVLTDTFDTLINSSVGATGAGYIGHSIAAGTATGASCSTVASSGGRALTCNFATIPVCTAGVDCPKVTVQVRPGGDGGTRTNYAGAISNGTADPNHANDTASVSNTILARADVTVTKTANPEPIAAGQNLTYVVTAHNNGPSRADAVSITDTLPLDVTFVSASPSSGSCGTTPGANATTTGGNRTIACSLGNINNGSQQTVTIVVRPNTATHNTTLTNNVTVATTTTETDGTNNSASVNSTVSPPSLDLVINKHDSVDPVAVGDNTVYTITVTNAGPSAAENVTVTDTLPASGLSFQSYTTSAGSCTTVPAVDAVGGTLTCNLGYLASNTVQTVTVTMKGVVKGIVNNTATVSSDETVLGFEFSGNNTVSEQTTARTKADMEVVSKTPSLTTVNLRDDFNFVVRVRNNTGTGLAEADGVTVTDTLPTNMELTGTPTINVVSGTTTATATPCTGAAASTSFSCALGTVSSGAVIDITLPVQLIATTSQGQIFTNTATVASVSYDTNAANNSNSGSVTVNSSTLSGHVIRDFNDDGLLTAGDTDITGIVITLTGNTFDGIAITRTATTTATGFTFANLPQSNATGYTISEGAVGEANLLDGKDVAGDHLGDATTVNDKVSGIVLGAHDAASGYLFAEVPQARIGIAKAVQSGPTANGDGTFSVTFRMVVKNLSLEAVNTVTVTDQLSGLAPFFGTYNAGTLGGGEYKITAAPSSACSGMQAGFTGDGANTTVAIVPTMTTGATCTIDFTLRGMPTSPLPTIQANGGRYENQAVADAVGTLSGQTSATNPYLHDLSDNGSNPDANGNGRANDANENDMTPVAPNFSAAVGIAKQVNGNVVLESDGSLTVPIRLVVTNVGNEPMHSVSVTDPLSSAASGQFGTFVAGGSAATLTSGKYTLQTAPAFSGACTNGSTNAAYTGHTGNTTIATISAMVTTAPCTIDFTYRFMPTTATTYTNQAQVGGTSDYTSSAVSDLSDNGSNPDPNGNGVPGDAGENDPTPIPVPRIGIAKSVGSVVNNGDGTYTAPFTLTIRNMGQTALSNVQVTDAIAGVLPQFGTYTANAIPAPGEYTISSAPAVSGQTNGAVLTAVSSGTFTGNGANNLLVAASSSLPNFGASPSYALVKFSVRYFPITAGTYNNTATITATPPGGGTVSDNSVDGSNPDANSNGDPTDDASPTVINQGSQYIGVAKAVSGIVQTGARRFRIPYTLIVANTSTSVSAINVQVADNLSTVFTTAQSITLSTPAAVSGCTGTVLTIASPAYTGIGQNNLLTGNQNLQPGERCTITFTTEVDFGSNPLPATVQNNQATATTSQTAGGTIIATDLSDNGSNPDANGNGNPGDAGEDDPTPVSFSSASLSTVTGKVYVDKNGNLLDDDGAVSSSVNGFTVEVLNSASQIIGTATTDSSGSFSIGGLFPSTTGNTATYYSLRFRDPANGAIYGTPQSIDPTPARNGVVVGSTITQLQLATGVTTLGQNLPLAPSGAIGIAKQLNSNVTVAADGSLIVPIRLVVTNVGNEPLHTVSVTDPLSSAVSGNFGTYVAGGSSATLSSGQYTVQSAPSFSGACTNGSTVAGFTGHSGNTSLATISAMAMTASCTIDFTYRFKPATATTYTNQARADGTSDYTGTAINDFSDNGSNPDPNGNGNASEAGENDPTPIPVPLVGIAKSAGGVVRLGDGTYTVPFTLTIRNMGQTALNSVQITDAIAGALPQFGTYTSNAVPTAGQYTISSDPVVSNQTNGASLTAVAAGVFTGSGAGNALLVAASSSLPNFGASPSSAQVTFTVRFFPTTSGPFNNAATASASPPGGGTVTDNSVDGSDPDANGNGDPTDDASPTVIDLNRQYFGAAKAVGAIVQTGAKRFRIPYTLIVKNTNTLIVTATNVQLTDDLRAAFPTEQNITLSTPAAVSGCTGTVLTIATPAFTGIGQNNLLTGDQNMQPGEQCTVTFTAEVDFGTNALPSAVQNNQAIATTYQTPGGTVIATDLSNNGSDPDPNNNGNPSETGENVPTPVSFSSSSLSAISGKVYQDSNHNRADDDGAATSNVSGFIVEVLNATGQIVGSTTTDSTGSYTVTGLFPSTAGNAATYYSLRFREPASGAIYGLPQSADPTAERNGTIADGIVTQLPLATGVTTVNQNLPLDPSGVVYNSVTRTPVSGAQVTLLSGGSAVANNCLVGGINAQTTGASGQYQFLLINPAPSGCPDSGVYTLQVTQPGGYLPPDSIMIPPTAGPYTPTTGSVDAIQAQAGAPSGTQPTTYYTSFNLNLGTSSSVVNNHIALDPILGGAIVLSKKTPLVNVSRGDLVPYTITAVNTLAATLANIDLRDQLPPGFKFKAGTATLDGIPVVPTVNGRVLNWANLTFAPHQTRVIRLMTVVGSGVSEGNYVNQAYALNNIVNASVSNTATATVRVIPDPNFDCSDLIGKVFDDQNINGYQDEGEPGIANVRLATVNGQLVTTDAEGRFHVACAMVPNEDHGSNFIMKLDERTLPTGFRVTTENPRDVRLTRGKLSKLNFGATIHRVVRLDVTDAAYSSDALKAEWQAKLDKMPELLKQRPSVLRLAYVVGTDGEDAARTRLKALAKEMRAKWQAKDCCHLLQIEEELIQPSAAKREGK